MSPWHWALVIAVAVLLFGARRLPDAARSLGRSARILKAELSADRADGERTDGDRADTAPSPDGPQQAERPARPQPAPVADGAEHPDPPR